MVKILNVNEVNAKIANGEFLFIAADASILKQLHPGHWIGGSIPYFMGPSGGRFSKDLALVTTLPSFITNAKIIEYSANELSNIPNDYYDNGLSLIIIPSLSNVHLEFSKNSFSYSNLLSGNLVGWVSGTDLQAQNDRALVYNGFTNSGPLYDKAVVLHAQLPPNKFARTEIINIFNQDDTADEIEFFENTFEVTECLVNGKRQLFSQYLLDKKIDTRFPLVADYSGARINVSFKNIDADRRRVSLYAPVYPLTKYRIAKPIENYEKAFGDNLQNVDKSRSLFSCNCILNYLYANLEGKQCGSMGPITFGEIAYILLNQTIVHLFIEDAHD